jgi:hypothetical protein
MKRDRTYLWVILGLLLLILLSFIFARKAEASYTCNSTHAVCRDDACVRAAGIGTNECTVNEDCITPTPEVTPEVTPIASTGSGGSPPQFAGSSTNAPVAAICTVPIEAPILQGFKALSPTKVLWSWWPSVTQGIEHQWLTYGYTKNNMPYSVLDIPAGKTNQDTGELKVGIMRWAQVCAIKDGCVKCSEPLDP